MASFEVGIGVSYSVDAAAVEIVKRQLLHFHRADPAYGAGVAKALAVDFRPELVAAE